MGSSFMRKFHSFPVLGLPHREPSQTKIYNFKIYMLSEQTLKKIFKYFTYQEIVKIGSVCKWFYFIAGTMLNERFVSLTEIIEKKVTDLIKISKTNPKVYGYLKVLCIVNSEVKILHACCGDYVLNNTFYFNGGIIVDVIESILSSSDTKEASDYVSKLLIEVDKFLDNFDRNIEPTLLEKSVSLPQSWFGKKVIDLLECACNFDKVVHLCPSSGTQQKHCYLKGMYESRKVYSVKPPPSFPTNGKMTFLEIFMLIKYLRNHIRWNNTLFYQLQDNIENLPKDECMNESLPSLMFRKQKEINNIPIGPKRIIIDFELNCLKIFAPVKYRSYLQNINASFDSSESILFNESGYKMDLKLEIGYLDNENLAIVEYINLEQKNETCFASCKSEKINLNN